MKHQAFRSRDEITKFKSLNAILPLVDRRAGPSFRHQSATLYAWLHYDCRDLCESSSGYMPIKQTVPDLKNTSYKLTKATK